MANPGPAPFASRKTLYPERCFPDSSLRAFLGAGTTDRDRLFSAEDRMAQETARTPIRYRIDDARGLIFETWEGEISAVDLRNFLATYLDDPKVLELRRTLGDLRLAEIKFTGSDLMNIVSNVVIPRLRGASWKTAILVSKPVQYGVSRQWQVFAESFSEDSLFYDIDDAMTWLLMSAPS